MSALVSTAPVTTGAKATVVLIRAEVVSEAKWLQSRHRSERIIIDERGEKVRLRVIEYE